jgi:PmbA protein
MYAYSDVARSFDDLDSKKCVNGALAYALPLLQAHPVKTGRYDVVFEIDQLSQLISSFISVFSAKQVLEGRSGFKGRLGEQVASSLLTIIDDPVYKDGFGYTTFDSEGSSRQSLTLIENGRLTSFLHNTSTAKQFGAPNTAHAARGARGPLGVSSTQIRILEGQQSDADLYAGRILKIVGLKGIHSGTDAVSGHFSLAAEGCLYENGTIVQYVKGITISGNFFDLLSRAVAVENKVQVSSSKSFFAPSIRFEGLSIAGA